MTHEMLKKLLELRTETQEQIRRIDDLFKGTPVPGEPAEILPGHGLKLTIEGDALTSCIFPINRADANHLHQSIRCLLFDRLDWVTDEFQSAGIILED